MKSVRLMDKNKECDICFFFLVFFDNDSDVLDLYSYYY